MEDTKKFKSSSSFTLEDGTVVDKIDDIKNNFDERVFDDYNDNQYRKNIRDNLKSTNKLKTISAINAMGETVCDTANYVDEAVTNIIYDNSDEDTRKAVEDRLNKRKSSRRKTISLVILIASIIYLVLPLDIFPEAIIPIIGYIEDLTFITFAIKQVASAFK